VANVVVVQSDDLAAWVGAVSGLVGVVLGAAIDQWRRRSFERRRVRENLRNAGVELVAESGDYTVLHRLAGSRAREPAWMEIQLARSARVRAALRTIHSVGDSKLNEAAEALALAAVAAAEADNAPNVSRALHDARAAFNDAVNAARL